MDKNLLEIIVCPKCKGKLELDESGKRLLCSRCRLSFEIKNGIPILLMDEAKAF